MKQAYRPLKRTWRRLGVAVGITAVAALAFCWGRLTSSPDATAAPITPPAKADKAPPPPAGAQPQKPSDYAQRVVAYYHGLPITREELGEYLIARQGADKLEYLVNKRIIEHACKEKGIEITPAEVEASLAADLKGLSLSMKDFENRLLKEYRKTVFEWKEDVIWPKLALTKLCRERVKVEPKDLSMAFEAYYGEKLEGRIILFPKTEEAQAMKIWPIVRDSDGEFTRYAKQQPSPTLQASGGKLPQPIGHNTTGDPDFEKEIFALRPGEVSTVRATPDGVIIFKCDKKIPADTTVKLESVRAKLEKEIIDKKIQADMQVYFKELRAKANPKVFLKTNVTQEELERTAVEEIGSEGVVPIPSNSRPPTGK